MAKSQDETSPEGPGTEEATALGGGTRLFQDGPPPMVLDFEVADVKAPEAGTPGAEAAEQPVSLALEDLLPDAAGEVVVLAGGDLPVNLLVAEAVIEAGIAPAHITAGGMEVTGLHYYSFESGVTVYSPGDLLILNDPNAG